MSTESIRCRHRPACDGCPMFETDPVASYAAKVDEVGEAMSRYALHSWPAPQPVASGRSLGYRNRARMIADDGHLGLYRTGSRDVVPIEVCLVHEPAVEAVLAAVRSSSVVSALRSIDVRANEHGEAIATFGVAERPAEDVLTALRELASPTVSVHLDIGTRSAFLSGQHERLEGQDVLTMGVGGMAFEVPPAAFFQVNGEVLEQIHGVVRPWIAGAEPLWDLYCGVGVHGLACMTPGQALRGFDIDAAGIDAARRNAARHNVEAVYQVESDAAFAPNDDGGHAIANPARAGLAWTLPAAVGAAKIQRLAYISCAPQTFLRDAERLANEGFALRAIHTFDMMPRTSHIELVGLFEQAGLPRRWEALGGGVTGTANDDREQVWVALIDGAVPRHATLPGGEVRLERLRTVDGAAVVQLHAPGKTNAQALLGLLKHWRHAVIGDEHGNRAANFRWRQAADVDVPVLHRLRCGSEQASVPDFLLTLFKLPRDVAER